MERQYDEWKADGNPPKKKDGRKTSGKEDRKRLLDHSLE